MNLGISRKVPSKDYEFEVFLLQSTNGTQWCEK